MPELLHAHRTTRIIFVPCCYYYWEVVLICSTLFARVAHVACVWKCYLCSCCRSILVERDENRGLDGKRRRLLSVLRVSAYSFCPFLSLFVSYLSFFHHLSVLCFCPMLSPIVPSCLIFSLFLLFPVFFVENERKVMSSCEPPSNLTFILAALLFIPVYLEPIQL